MDNVIVYSKIPNSVLLINKENIKYVDTKKSIEIQAIQVDLTNFEIFEPELLERYLKFAPWEEVSIEESENFKGVILNNLSQKIIQEKILIPLTKNLLN